MRPRAGRIIAAVAGPVLIVLGPVLVLNGYSLRGRLNTSDTLDFFLPFYCFLGKQLVHGHVPLWNPYVMAGAPLAADPQSGWMHVPAMAMFAAFPCDVAVRWMVVLHPVLAGLGIHWFLRSEGMSRALAAVGGLALALPMAGSNMAASLPFAGTLAWTALGLAAASRFVRAGTWPARLGWAGLTAGAWGQLAAAHLSAGLLMGTMTIGAYLLAKAWSGRLDGRRSLRASLGHAALLAVLAPLVNLAFLWPRLGYLGETTLALGYGRLQEIGASAAGLAQSPIAIGQATRPSWPLALATFPGAHPGAIVLVLAFAAWWSREHRALVVAFALLGTLLYVASLQVVARHVPPALRSVRLVDLYLHNPVWWTYELLLIIAVLGSIGVLAWLHASSWTRRVVMVLPGVVIWGILPLVLGATPLDLSVLAGGAAVGAVCLLLARRFSRLLPLVALAVAAELMVNGLIVGTSHRFGPPILMRSLADPTLVAARYVVPGPIVRGIQRGDARYVKVGTLGFEEKRKEIDEGVIPNHALLFGIENIGGYQAVQLARYFVLVRAAQHADIKYNVGVFEDPPPPPLLDLLGVGYIISSGGFRPEAGAVPVLAQDYYVLYRRGDVPPRASVVTDWRVAPGPHGLYPNGALAAVTAPTFDSTRQAVLETDPGMGSPSGQATGVASVRMEGPDRMRVEVRAPAPALLVIRVPYEPHWRATVDGRPATVLRADYLLQAVPVPPGRHVVEMVYRDPAIARGLAGSGAAVLGLVLAAVVVRRRSRTTVAPDDLRTTLAASARESPR